ncbi:MAG TPA: DUF916 domain-containing protein [Patescibacteria group bacterium]|nr:DUF916 domain-containing protein [Patescibacteria group bacterium]
MKKLREIGILSVALLTIVSAGFSALANAANANGYKVSPVRTDLVIEPGTSKTFSVFIQNVSGNSENLQVLINDFGPTTSETGQPALLLNGQEAPSHGLKQYITIPNGPISLQSNEQKSVKVQISIPKDAPGGGYYGAIRFAPAGAAGDKNVNLSASVASLVLVKVPGQITEKLSIASFDVRSGDSPSVVFTNHKGLQAVVRFQNSGDVQEEPFGKIQLKKGSTILSTTEINNTDPRGNVLPDSVRRFSVSLDKLGSFGKYTVVGNFGYGSSGQLLSAKTTFYIIPLFAIIIVAAAILFILFLIFVLPRWIRAYDRRVVRRANRR